MKQDTTYKGLDILGYEQTREVLLKLKQGPHGRTWAFVNGMELAIRDAMSDVRVIKEGLEAEADPDL
jgi:hypothetical protein